MGKEGCAFILENKPKGQLKEWSLTWRKIAQQKSPELHFDSRFAQFVCVYDVRLFGGIFRWKPMASYVFGAELSEFRVSFGQLNRL